MNIYPVINHIALYVHNLERSTSFYSNVFRFPQLPEPFKDGKHTWFEIGPACQLHLIEGAKDIYYHHINTHISFGTLFLQEFIENLNRQQVPFYDAEKNENKINIRPDGKEQIFFQDPDGYWLEVNNDVS